MSEQPGEWIEYAACAARGVDVFVCDVRESGARKPARRYAENNAIAKRICAGCPVRPMCLDWAMQLPDPAYNLVAGGLTHRERSRERRRARKRAAEADS